MNYSVFTQKPILKKGLNIPKGDNEYGMALKEISPDQHDSEGEEYGN